MGKSILTMVMGGNSAGSNPVGPTLRKLSKIREFPLFMGVLGFFKGAKLCEHTFENAALHRYFWHEFWHGIYHGKCVFTG